MYAIEAANTARNWYASDDPRRKRRTEDGLTANTLRWTDEVARAQLFETLEAAHEFLRVRLHSGCGVRVRFRVLVH